MRLQPGQVHSFWDDGIFESDAALQAVACLDSMAKLDTITPLPSQKNSVYSLYAAQCSSPEAAIQVREHLDSGILHTLTAKMVANYFNPLRLNDYTCFGYLPLLLGACAMSLGCKTLLTAPGYHMFFDTYEAFLGGIFSTTPLTDVAIIQMQEALFGPNKFQPGIPIDFATFGRAKPGKKRSPIPFGDCMFQMLGGKPTHYKGEYRHGDGLVLSAVGPVAREDLHYGSVDECGGCQKKLTKGLMCSRCKAQQYCGKECQREDFARHKKVCWTVEDARAMKELGSMWCNTFYISLEAASVVAGAGGQMVMR